MPFGADQAAVDRVTAQLAGVGRLGRRLLRRRGLVRPARAGGPRARARPGCVAVLGVSPSLAADERAAAHEVARSSASPVVEVATHEGDRPATGPTARTAASTARTSCSPGSTTRSSRAHGLTRSPTARTPTTPARPDRPGAARRHRARRAAPAGRRRARQGRRTRASPAALGAALRRQAGRALPGLPDPALRGGHPGEAGPDRAGRGGAARARLRRLPGPPPRRHRPARAARRGPGRGRPTGPLRGAGPRRSSGAGFRFVDGRPGRHPVRRLHPAAGGGRTLADGRPPGRPELAGIADLDLGPGRAAAAIPRPSTARARRPSRSRPIAAALRRPGGPSPCSPAPRRSTPRRSSPSCPTRSTPRTRAAGLARRAAGADRADWSSCSRPAPPICRWPGRRCSPRGTSAGTPSWSSTSAWPGCTGSWRGWTLLRRGAGDRRGRRDGRRAAQRRRRAGGGTGGRGADLGRATAPRSRGWRRC